MACAAGRAREAEFVRKECDARQDNREDAAEVGDDPRARVDAVTEPNSNPIDQLRAVRVRRVASAHTCTYAARCSSGLVVVLDREYPKATQQSTVV